MNINKNVTSAIVYSLLRLVRDGSALHGLVGARYRGAAGATGKQTALYAFGLLSQCFNVLSANRLTGLRGTNTPRISLLCCASEPKHEMDCDIRPGSVLALYPVGKQPVLRTGKSTSSELAPSSCWWICWWV